MTNCYTIMSNRMDSEMKVAQLCPTFHDPMYYTVHGILQARILDWIAVPFSRDLPNPMAALFTIAKTWKQPK